MLALPVLDVRYQDVVLDTEEQARRMLEFLDLPWDERCLRFYENPRRVATASEEQVRRPVYTSSIGRWKHYERHLGNCSRRWAGGPRARRGAARARRARARRRAGRRTRGCTEWPFPAPSAPRQGGGETARSPASLQV